MMTRRWWCTWSRWSRARCAACDANAWDLSGPYRKTIDDTLEHVVQVADPLPSDSPREPEVGRVSSPRAERDAESSRPQARPRLPRPRVADQRARTARRTRRTETPRVARWRRPPWRRAHDLARQGDDPLHLRRSIPGACTIEPALRVDMRDSGSASTRSDFGRVRVAFRGLGALIRGARTEQAWRNAL